jgi:CelD/BcsL family acetyltransferase involved in cellulose biosynthesis
MTVVKSDPDITVRVLRSSAEWEAVACDWDPLVEASCFPAASLHFGWLHGWWKIYSRNCSLGESSLRVITIWRASELLGALPLYESSGGKGLRGGRCLRFLSTGEPQSEETCPDYLGLVCRPGAEEVCIDGVRRGLASLPWDCIELEDLAADSRLARAALSGVLPGQFEVVSRGSCPYAEIEGGLDRYFALRSSQTRQQLRRKLRDAEKHGARLEIASPETFVEFFEDLVRLHQERWTADGQPGCFAAPRFMEFHRGLIQEWIGQGRVVLARLTLDGRALAAIYGFAIGRRFEFYQSGMSTSDAGPLKSPGIVAHLCLMRELSARGTAEYDFLRGGSFYKMQLATGERAIISLRIWRRGIRTALRRSSHVIERAARRALALLSR